MKLIVAPDSFKGTATSAEICETIKKTALALYPDTDVRCIPMADGGEGTVDAFLYGVGGTKRFCPVQDPYDRTTEGYYAVCNGFSVVEMAVAAGIHFSKDHADICKASTYGVGQLIRAALDDGAKKIIIGVGGSATNDGGTGALQALGVRFLNRHGQDLRACGGTLGELDRIDITDLDPRLADTEITVMCDVQNPLCGEQGASAVFGPQKGATPEDIQHLDANLRHYAACVKKQFGKEMLTLTGGGAAGGLSAGLWAFCGAKLQSGINTVLDAVQFETVCRNADLIITGEGKADAQSLYGKVPFGVAKRANGIPVVVLAGALGDNAEALYDHGVTAMFSLNRVCQTFEEAAPKTLENVGLATKNILRLFFAH